MITPVESSYLTLIARRVLNARRAAEARGEVYFDISAPLPLSNGYRVRLDFKDTGPTYKPRVTFFPPDTGETFPREALESTATTILKGPVHCVDEMTYELKP